MAKKKLTDKGVIRNKRARFDYELGDSFVMGIVLNGRETKNLRLGHGQLRGSYVTIKNGELWLINALVSGTNGIPIEESEATQARKLLASKKEINQIIAAKQQGAQIIPTEILTKGKFIKVRVSLGTSKKHKDKRQTIKQREDNIEAGRQMRNTWR